MRSPNRRAVRVVLTAVLAALLLAWLREGATREAAALEPEEAPLEQPARPAPAGALPPAAGDAPAADVEDRTPAPARAADEGALDEADDEAWVEQEQWEEWGTLPPDPPESGPCALALELVDARSGAFVASDVLLWRLDAPANDDWEAGDQLQLSTHVPAGGALLRGLPAGRYRARCAAEVHGAEDPAAFVVEGERTEVRLALRLPVERRFFARLFDRRGSELSRARVRLAGSWWGTRAFELPGWRTERACKLSNVITCQEELEGAGAAGEWTPRRAGPDGFELGALVEDSRAGRNRWLVELLADDGGLARVEVRGDPAAPTRFVAVALDPAEVARFVFLSDGAPVEAADGRVTTAARALPAEGGDPLELWRDVPVDVHVRGDERHADLSFELSLAEWPPAERFLAPESE